MKVSIERVLELKHELHLINEELLCDIEWTRKGLPLEVLDSDLDDWRFTGLNNTDFVSFVLENY